MRGYFVSLEKWWLDLESHSRNNSMKLDEANHVACDLGWSADKLEEMGFLNWGVRKEIPFSAFVSLFVDHHYLSLSAVQACWKMFTVEFSEAQDLFKIYEGHSFPTVKLPSFQRPSEAAALCDVSCLHHTAELRWSLIKWNRQVPRAALHFVFYHAHSRSL